MPASGIMVKPMPCDTMFKAVVMFSVAHVLLGVSSLAAKSRWVARAMFCPGFMVIKCSFSKKRMSMLGSSPADASAALTTAG